MTNVQLVAHPLIQTHLAVLRSKSTPRSSFRSTLINISALLAYEISRNFRVRNRNVDTPLEQTSAEILNEKVCLVAVLRAALGMQEGFLRMMPEARVGHIGLFRDESTLEPVKYFVNLPGGLDNDLVILLDPMLATGGSLKVSVDLLKQHGAKRIQCVVVIAAPEGVQRLHEHHPEIKITAAALDRGLDENGFILPGLGDAGDRQYGTGD
jgi:uracil phosphoribosyltransferase